MAASFRFPRRFVQRQIAAATDLRNSLYFDQLPGARGGLRGFQPAQVIGMFLDTAFR
jgi:hypothetical protein